MRLPQFIDSKSSFSNCTHHLNLNGNKENQLITNALIYQKVALHNGFCFQKLIATQLLPINNPHTQNKKNTNFPHYQLTGSSRFRLIIKSSKNSISHQSNSSLQKEFMLITNINHQKKKTFFIIFFHKYSKLNLKRRRRSVPERECDQRGQEGCCRICIRKICHPIQEQKPSPCETHSHKTHTTQHNTTNDNNLKQHTHTRNSTVPCYLVYKVSFLPPSSLLPLLFVFFFVQMIF